MDYIGSADSPRNAEQTEVANFWYPALNVACVQITRAILADTGRPLSWQARFVAAVNVITTDAQISIYNAKYTYLFWRPCTAITTGGYRHDPAWTSFWAAPRHPEYPSGHGGQIGSLQGVLDAFVGPHAPAPIPLTSPDAAGVTRTYTDWKTITGDVINARVWEGVHLRTSDVTGVDPRPARGPLGTGPSRRGRLVDQTRCHDLRRCRGRLHSFLHPGRDIRSIESTPHGLGLPVMIAARSLWQHHDAADARS